MTDERTRVRNRGGFTLIEVLVAMVILAIGLLALEALAVGSARMVVRADRESQYSALATERLEGVLQRIDLGQNPASGETDEDDGATVATVVTRDVVGARNVFTVTVTVTPPPGQGWSLRPVTVVGRAFR
ncbi:MAG TPA: prepilin-type N-terminal cleavage/methylation domain-containing protein [Longimicrobium sp.]|nr:prepilin-type N-terminal cleavage/methylation domain-containing protein [Longimicrobium sp.]